METSTDVTAAPVPAPAQQSVLDVLFATATPTSQPLAPPVTMPTTESTNVAGAVSDNSNLNEQGHALFSLPPPPSLEATTTTMSADSGSPFLSAPTADPPATGTDPAPTTTEEPASTTAAAATAADIKDEFAAEVREYVLGTPAPTEQLAREMREAHSGSAGERARCVFGVYWLHMHYERADNYNIPRQDMFDHYKKYCETHAVMPLNTASFGKFMRILWPDVKTRRLGNRGASKYHYCGVRVKGAQYEAESTLQMQNPFAALLVSGVNLALNPLLGDAGHITSVPLLNFPTVTDSVVPADSSREMVQHLLNAYQAHCQSILDTVQLMQFAQVEMLLRGFWTALPDDSRRLVSTPEVTDLMWRCDSSLYDSITNVLLPNPLHTLPLPVTQALRHFARQLETWILGAMDGYFPMLVARKVEVAKGFAQQLKRHTSLNFLAQAAAQVLESAEVMHSMFTEWSKLDFEGIKEQVGWVTECRRADVTQIAEVEIKNLLTASSRLEQWTVWLDSVIVRFLDEKLDTVRYIQQARQFIMKWNFYGSLCMRDLTLRSMSMFGSFHILKLFVDEYVFHVVEQRISNVQSGLPAAGALPPPPQPQHQLQQHSTGPFMSGPPPTTTAAASTAATPSAQALAAATSRRPSPRAAAAHALAADLGIHGLPPTSIALPPPPGSVAAVVAATGAAAAAAVELDMSPFLSSLTGGTGSAAAATPITASTTLSGSIGGDSAAGNGGGGGGMSTEMLLATLGHGFGGPPPLQPHLSAAAAAVPTTTAAGTSSPSTGGGQ
ncbi:RFX DNA-binding domain-containing protein [Blastocladiella britannica]|nr:RFX DNA-binding domain-containing protein [Blastocladiella britannica]